MNNNTPTFTVRQHKDGYFIGACSILPNVEDYANTRSGALELIEDTYNTYKNLEKCYE